MEHLILQMELGEGRWLPATVPLEVHPIRPLGVPTPEPDHAVILSRDPAVTSNWPHAIAELPTHPIHEMFGTLPDRPIGHVHGLGRLIGPNFLSSFGLLLPDPGHHGHRPLDLVLVVLDAGDPRAVRVLGHRVTAELLDHRVLVGALLDTPLLRLGSR